MDEKEKEIIKEESDETTTAEGGSETTTEATEKVVAEAGDTKDAAEGEPTEKVKNVKLRNALLRAGAALLAAVILLAVTGRSLIDLKNGAVESSAIQEEELGSFVKCQIFALIGFYDAGAEDSGTADSSTASASSGEYALVPMSDKFVTIHFSSRYLQSAATIEDETYKFINGEMTSFDKYLVVEGSTATLSEDMSTKMYEWFTLNKDWMVEAGVITDTDDIASYLSDTVLEVDVVNSMSETLVIALSALAAACLLYIIVELVLMATGFYLNGPKKKKAEENEEKPTEVIEAEETIHSEDSTESVETDATSEDAVSGEAETEKKSDVQEDK